MRKSTCYYLDSLRPGNVNPKLKNIIEVALVMYATESGCTKRVNVNWVNVRCPMQPLSSFECGYYVLKFMKEITYGGLEVLKDFEAGKDQYTEAEIDLIREEWSSYVSVFVYT